MIRPAVVHLNDLAHRYMWDPRAIGPFLAATGLDVEATPAYRAFAPPRVLVVIVPIDQAMLVRRARAWLADAAHVVVVRDRTAEREAPELCALQEEEWRDALAGLPRSEVIDWADAGEPAPCRAAIARAVERAREVEDVRVEPPVHDAIELPASAWVAITQAASWFEAAIAAQLRLRARRPVLIDATGAEVDLAAPPATIALDYTPEALRGLPAGMDIAAARTEYPGLLAGGFDPVHPIRWRGHRMAVYWYYLAAGGAEAFLSATDHDYPTGPSKKLWSYDDNDPVATAVTPAGDACAQTFDHDVLVTTGVPIGWHRAGAVDVAAFVGDPRRAVYYAQTEEFLEGASPDLLDEDARELAPVVVLGPDATACYAVDLRHRVVRITGAHPAPAVAEPVGGPDGGHVVCDAEHRIVRRATGVLLGGWFRHATIEDAGQQWREDLATGERTLLGSAARVRCVDPDVELAVQDAIREGRHDRAAQLRAAHETVAIEDERTVLAIPGTRNILEITPGYLRVV
jgi:hypothetical protein